MFGRKFNFDEGTWERGEAPKFHVDWFPYVVIGAGVGAGFYWLVQGAWLLCSTWMNFWYTGNGGAC